MKGDSFVFLEACSGHGRIWSQKTPNSLCKGSPTTYHLRWCMQETPLASSTSVGLCSSPCHQQHRQFEDWYEQAQFWGAVMQAKIVKVALPFTLLAFYVVWMQGRSERVVSSTSRSSLQC